MSIFENIDTCYACEDNITKAERQFSLRNFEYELCRSCQDYIRSVANEYTTSLVVWLWIELRSRNVPVELEKSDGFKTIDLAITEARCNIEVDGKHHHNFRQAMADLKRTRYSLQKGYVTLRIPNSLMINSKPRQLDKIVDEILLCIEAARDLQ